MAIRIGTAAWALPREVRDRFAPGSSNLERYATRLDCTEINSSFYRPHRRSTYMRWAKSVPAGFRFAVKLPKSITHEARLKDCEPMLRRFAEEIGGLGSKRGPVLVQLPPKLVFDPPLAAQFFAQLETIVGGALACEPRHASWFEPEADALLVAHSIARVAADPAPVAGAELPGGWRGLGYFRLHGSPRIYWSSYDEAALANWAERVKAVSECWVVFDNTASGSATRDALAFQTLV